MATTEERLQVLKMIEEGKVTADEGARLLRALSQQETPAGPTEPLRGASKPRWFRVRVTDTSTGRNKVNVNIPMGLVNVGLRMGARFIPDSEGTGEPYRDLVEIVESGRTGKVFEARDDAANEMVEIFVE
jgi:hypothetical protein